MGWALGVEKTMKREKAVKMKSGSEAGRFGRLLVMCGDGGGDIDVNHSRCEEEEC